MSKKSAVLMPQTREILGQLGEQIRLARLRRGLSSELAAARAGISRQTLSAIEKGAPTVAMGFYAAALHVLNDLDADLLLVARADTFGRRLQNLDLPPRKHAPRREGPRTEPRKA